MALGGKRRQKELKGTTQMRGKYFPDEPLRSEKVERNAPCSCGSGLKAKKCCLTRSGLAAWWYRLFHRK